MVRGFYAKPSFFRISATICGGVRCDFDGHRLLRLFQISELAGENLLIGKVSFPQAQALRDQLGTSLQVYKPDLRPNFEFPPVGCVSGRSMPAQHCVSPAIHRVIARSKTLQPRLAGRRR